MSDLQELCIAIRDCFACIMICTLQLMISVLGGGGGAGYIMVIHDGRIARLLSLSAI